MPSPDDSLGDLDKLFGLESQGIIVNYSLNPAWG
jgi:hypothetical protein